MRYGGRLVLPLACLTAACSSGARDDAPASAAAISDALSITACSAPMAPAPNYVVSGDGRYLVYESCAAPGTQTVLRRVDLTTKQVTDLEQMPTVETLALAPGGNAFYVLERDSGHAIPQGTLRLWTFDRAPHRDFADAWNPTFTADGHLLFTYAENLRAPFGQYGNGYRLAVRVRSVDGAIDSSATFDQDRGGDFTTNGFAIRGVAFAPDASHVVFWRSVAGFATLDRFDIASGTIIDNDMSLFGAERVVLEAYDGASVPYVVVDAGVNRVLKIATRHAATTTLPDRLLDLDLYGKQVKSYSGTYCTTAVKGTLFYWSQSGNVMGGSAPAQLVAWDAHSGPRTVLTVAGEQAPGAPRSCPRATPSGSHLVYATASLGAASGGAPGVAVLANTPGAQPVVLDGPPPQQFGPTVFDTLVDDAHVAVVPSDTAAAPAPITILDLASGAVSSIPTTPAAGSYFSARGSLDTGSSLFTGAGSLVCQRGSNAMDANGKYVTRYDAWTIDTSSPSPSIADSGQVAERDGNDYRVPAVYAIPSSPRFVAAKPRAGQVSVYDLTIAVP